MGYIRLVWTLLGVVIMLILSIPLLLIGLLIGLFSMDARDKYTMSIIRLFFEGIILLTGTRVHLSGLENVPKDQPVLYIGNHRSFFDIIVSYRLFPSPTAFIAKKEIEKVPLLSWWMKMMHNLFLDRKDIKQGLKTILTAIEHVKNGISICVFPEGTRNKSEEIILPFHDGSFKVADKSGCLVVPMTFYNTSQVFEDHLPKITREDVFVHFGDPIDPNALEKDDRKHLGEYVRNIMIKEYEELKKQYEELKSV